MIYSMTGFTRYECPHSSGHYYWELRTVNHRFLEVSFKLPEGLRDIELALRDKIRNVLSRGKVECSLYFAAVDSAAPAVTLNRGLLKQLINAHTEVAVLLSDAAPVDPLSLMRWPGVLTVSDTNLDDVKPFLLQSFDEALSQLSQVRQREGNAILETITQRLQQMQQYVHQLDKMLPQMIQQQRDKIMLRVQQLGVDFEPARVEQEVVLLAQRADVAEEIDRLSMHITEMESSLQNGGVLGRRLDFLLQEMQREANTLGSKSNDMQTTHIAVELKVLIEQIREQIQNIE